MNQCSQCCSSAILVTGGCRLSWLHGRAAGQVVDSPGRRRNRRRLRQHPASSREANLPEMLFIMFTSSLPQINRIRRMHALTPSARPSESRAPAPGAIRAAHSAPHAPERPGPTAQSATGRRAGLHPDPFAVELARSSLPALSSSTTSCCPAADRLAIGRMPCIHQECRAHRRQFEPGERQDQRGPLKPEECPDSSDTTHSDRYIQPSWTRRDRTVAPQEPVDVLARDRGEAKNKDSSRVMPSQLARRPRARASLTGKCPNSQCAAL
jgi:hypothetical protein